MSSSVEKYEILIVGGGSGGIGTAAQLANKLGSGQGIAVVDPSSEHYYQSLWTLVGGGMCKKEESIRPMESVVPDGVKFIHEAVKEIDPDGNKVVLSSGNSVQYEYLVVAAGMQLDWGKVKGLEETIGKNDVVSIYSYETLDAVWESIKTFKGGEAIFTQPSTLFKCGAAPQKIMWLAEDYWRNEGMRDKANISFIIPQPSIFPVKKYADVLTKRKEEKGVNTLFEYDLVEVRAEEKVAVFKKKDGTELIRKYDLLHVVPPMSAPACVKNSPLVNQAGYVDVDKFTLQHAKYPNVFSLGDCSALPTPRSGAGVEVQAPVLVHNLLQVMKKQKPTAEYDGYTACPVITGYNSGFYPEFKYGFEVCETLPIDQSKDRAVIVALKKDLLPWAYWELYLKGLWYGPRGWIPPVFPEEKKE